MKYIDKKAFIFDLDGVIIFTDRFHYQAWKHLADRLGIDFDESVNHRLRGISRAKSFDIILEKSNCYYSRPEKEKFIEQKNEYYKGLLKMLSPSDISREIRDTLWELKGRGYQLAIGSSSKNAKFILSRTAMTDYFDAISDGTNISRPKPDPEVFQKAAQFMNVNPHDCIVVEDAYAGIEAAKCCGMAAIGIGEASSCDKADFSIQYFSQLLDIVT